MTYVFLDTMIYLHYTWFEDIGWQDIVGDQKIQIVVPHITLDELDTHKDNHKSPKIRERARKVASRLFKCITTRDGNLPVGEFDESSAFDFTAHHLDKMKNDHRLLASILEFKETHSEPVLLMTQDIGPRLKANRLDIDAKPLPEAYRLPTEEDPVIKENKKFKNELLKIKSAMPKLSLVSAVTNDGKIEEIAFPAEESIDVDREMKSARSQCAAEMKPDDEGSDSNLFLDSFSFRDRHQRQMSKSEYAKKIHAIYKREWKRYLEEYESYLNNLKQMESRCNIALELKIFNSGERPVEEVNLTMTFPEEQEVFLQNDPPKKPEPPKIPVKRSTLAPQLCRVDAPDSKGFVSPKPFSLKKEKAYTFRLNNKKISHGLCQNLPVLVVSFTSYESACPIQIKYRISADNLPQPVEGVLNVIVKKEENE